jgi:uncharacterized protein YjbI with pentapeptide repeats
VDEETKPKRKAKDNPWYRLATLHGEPSSLDDDVAARNRATWNRYMASAIGDSPEELRPFSQEELHAIQSVFADRSGIEGISDIDFSDVEFDKPFFAQGFVFPKPTTFHGATFSGHADFDSATFSGHANFSSATFSQDANFSSATFSGSAAFDGATFSGHAEFISAFSSAAEFRRAKFCGTNIDFGGATFCSDANFTTTIFSGYLDFQEATWLQMAVFVNSEMRSETGFYKATFFEPPQFFGAKLHEGTSWHDVTWPEKPKDAVTANDYVDAYERLKLEMDRLKKHWDELDFFARELQCRQVVLGWKGLPIALYGALCGHGRYYMRPLGILVVVVILGAIPIRAHFGGGWALATFTEHPIGGGALGLSFANTFGFLGIRKDLIAAELLQGLPGWLKVIATIQTILGILLLFLFGLGIRNRFRMR